MLDYTDDTLTVRVVCSKGTYIRALARDIGAALSSGAHLTALRRTRVGQYSESDCLSIEEAVKMIADSKLTENNNPSPRDGETEANK